MPRANVNKEQAPRLALNVKSKEDPYTRLAARINPAVPKTEPGTSNGHVPEDEEAELGRLLYAVGIGDESAFTMVATRYRKLMTSAALYVVHNLADAEDAVQDALVTVWQRCRDYQIEHPAGFLVGMARGAALNIINRRHAMKRGGRHPERLEQEMAQRVHGLFVYRRAGLEHQMIERVPDNDVGAARMAMVHRLIGEVPPVFVGVLDAFFFQGKDERDLADQHGDTPNGIRQKLHDGLEVIRHLARKEESHAA